MGRPHNSILVAEFLQANAMVNGQSFNMTKTQKLLYILTGWFWVKHNCRILHERSIAWIYGPIFPATRDYFDCEKVQRIDDPKFNPLKEDTDLIKAIDCIIKRYGHAESTRVMVWSMDLSGPWAKTILKPGFQWYDPISELDIREYFIRAKI